MAEARKDLGRQLAAWRDAAGLTQVQLAQRIPYSRSTVANVEIGRHCTPRQFWQYADGEVGAAGALLAAFEHVDRLAQAQRDQAARAVDQQRQQRAGWAPPVPEPAPDECGCGLTVARWTGRESRALREALRMSLRAFAEHLGVTTSTVSDWENRATPAPLRLATQAVLDQALKLADADAKTRFVVLLDSVAPGPSGAVTGDGGGVARRSVVTPLRRPERARTAS